MLRVAVALGGRGQVGGGKIPQNDVEWTFLCSRTPVDRQYGVLREQVRTGAVARLCLMVASGVSGLVQTCDRLVP